jgi:hypothetical protein
MSRFKATASKYPVLHFASHGVLDDVNPLYSRLLLATGSESEDGFLEAREIMKLDLHADLAVLSACQTARGQVGSFKPRSGRQRLRLLVGYATLALPHYLKRILVFANSEKSRVAEFVVFGPLDETNLDHDLGLNPVGAEAR